MTRRLLLSTALMGALSFATPALAQENVAVRTNSHDGYQRMVLEWQAVPDYKVTREGGKLTLTFTRPGKVDTAKIKALENIQGVAVTSGAGGNLALTLTVPAKSDIRDLKAGKRVIVDVYDPPGGRQKIEPPPAPKEKPAPTTKKEEPKKEPIAEKPAPAKEEPPKVEAVKTQEAPKAVEEKKAEPVKADETPVAEKAPEKIPEKEAVTPVEKKEEPAATPQPAAPAIEPHVVTVTSTKKIALAVFERGEWLWFISDDPGMNVPPALSGPQVEKFGLMQRFEAEGGTAYRIRKPDGAGITAEGGGLRWRIVISPNAREVQSIAPERLSPVAAGETDKTPRKGAALLFPLKEPKKIVTLKDPDIGDQIKAVTMPASGVSARAPYEFVEVATLPSYVGLAYLPLADDVQAAVQPDGVRIGRGAEDMAVSISAVIEAPEKESSIADPAKAPPVNEGNLYHLSRWQMGGLKALAENQNALMAGMTGKDDAGKVEDLLTLGKLMLANERGAEAVGYLRAASQIMPEIVENAEYIGLRGAASLVAGQPDLAITDLVNPALDRYRDIPYWRMATYADLEDWQQAIKVMPKDTKDINDYPDKMREWLSLAVAEVGLRGGHITEAERILADMEPAAGRGDMHVHDKAAWTYLMGEAARQLKQYDKSKTYWGGLEKSKDDYYRARSGLALTRLLLERNEIDPAKAIDRLEGLRYSWRGDELEALANYRLGQVYVENDEYLKGLNVLRNAVTLAPGSQMGREVTEYMARSFRTLFDSDELQKVSPLQAIGVYEEFKELMPPDQEGNRITEQLAERMVDADLLSRGEALFSDLLANRLKGQEAGRVALRLAAIRLLNNKPEAALKNLEQAEALYKEGEEKTVPPDKMREITLLRASALSKTGKAESAIDEMGKLPADKTTARLKADIAWKNQRWRDAADGLQSLIDVEQIRPDQPLTPDQTDLVLNYGIALNLAGDRVGLGTLRDRYSKQMGQTPKAELFDVVTLPRRFGLIRSRDTIAETINNVDLFKGFLESYRKVETPPAAAEEKPAAPATPAQAAPDAAKTDTTPTPTPAQAPAAE